MTSGKPKEHLWYFPSTDSYWLECGDARKDYIALRKYQDEAIYVERHPKLSPALWDALRFDAMMRRCGR